MLPFLKNAKEASVHESNKSEMRKPDMEEDEEFDSLGVAAHDILQAIKRDSGKDLVSALKAFVELCDEEPHQEGPHE